MWYLYDNLKKTMNVEKKELLNFDEAVKEFRLSKIEKIEKSTILWNLLLKRKIYRGKVYWTLKRYDWTLSNDWTLHKILFQILNSNEIKDIIDEGAKNSEFYITPIGFDVKAFNQSYLKAKESPIETQYNLKQKTSSAS